MSQDDCSIDEDCRSRLQNRGIFLKSALQQNKTSKVKTEIQKNSEVDSAIVEDFGGIFHNSMLIQMKTSKVDFSSDEGFKSEISTLIQMKTSKVESSIYEENNFRNQFYSIDKVFRIQLYGRGKIFEKNDI